MATTHEIRERLHLSQREFADTYSIPHRTVTGWDSKGTMPEYLRQIFGAYIDALDEIDRLKKREEEKL